MNNPPIILLLAFLWPFILSAKIDFVHQVMPILKKNCAECHTDGKKKGGLSMNTRAEFLAGGENGEMAVPGNIEDSWFLELVASDDLDERMPPKGPGVSPEQFKILHQWVKEGMVWEDGITLGSSGWEPKMKPRVVKLPKPSDNRPHPIDRILDNYLENKKINLPTGAPARTFVRRAYLDIIGILPTPEQLNAFIHDKSSDKNTKLIDQLLAEDISYADHWLTFWNDLLRNDYTGTGFITGGRKQITTWLYNALKGNMPYDQMTRELIDAKPDAAGFINGIKWRGSVNASQTRDMQFAQNVSQVFLGINMKCASCHDSFIDRWTLQEAYDLAAVFSEEPLELERCDIPTGKMATPKWMFPEIGQIDPKANKNERLKQLAKLMTHPKNGRFTRTIVNRIWAQLMGRGIVHPVDAMHTKPWSEDLLDFLAVQFANDGYDLRKFLKFVMTSEAYGSQTDRLEFSPGEEYVYNGPVPKRMTAEQLMDTIWQVTQTNPNNAEAKVDRSSYDKTTPLSESKDLPKIENVSAKWIWASDPQTRKIKLRTTIELKTKPVFTSLLATCDNAFSLKVNGKFLTSSREWNRPIYHEVSDFFKAGKNLIEVNAEMFGGGSGFIAQFSFGKGKDAIALSTDKTWEVQEKKKWNPAKVVHNYGAGPWKRILDKAVPTIPGQSTFDGPSVRAALVKNDFLMRSLGRPHRDQVVTSRPAELTMLQAIDLANGDILSKYLNMGAKNLTTKASDSQSFINWLYEHTLGRLPTKGEKQIIASVMTDPKDTQQVEDLLWLVFMQPDFQIIR
jgi:hypothetical protein